MQINMTINSEELIEAASKMPLDEKLRLYDKIKDDIFEFRFRNILEDLKTDDLSDEEILQEVEHVRSERYKNRS
jgi:hypothetical protein